MGCLWGFNVDPDRLIPVRRYRLDVAQVLNKALIMSRETIAHINLNALSHNLERVRAMAPGKRVMAVVKADAYGHGLHRVAQALTAADLFAVATFSEAQVLRRHGLAHPILLLEGFHCVGDLPLILQQNLELVVHNDEQLRVLEQFNWQQHAGLSLRRAWLKLDTGMHRLGFAPERCHEVYQRLQAIGAIQEVALMSHFACADEPEHALNPEQIRRFEAAVAGIDAQQSFANSAAIVHFPDAHCDWVRSGIMLYGVSPTSHRSAASLGLQAALTLSTRLLAVHQIRAGESLGYGADFVCPEDMPVGIAAIGYGDGYPRHAKNGTPILVNGRLACLAGRVSMDMIAIDLRTVTDAQVGDRVTLWGEGLPIETVAAHADAIPYQLLCGITNRVEYRTSSDSLPEQQQDDAVEAYKNERSTG